MRNDAKFCFFENSHFLMTFQNIFDFHLEFPSETADLLDFPLCLQRQCKGKSIKSAVSEGNSKVQIKNILKNHQNLRIFKKVQKILSSRSAG